MRTGFAVIAFVVVGSSVARPASPGIDSAVQAAGGEIFRDEQGRIIELSLARTWATDRDLEWAAALTDLKRLDLSLTYVTDRGIERLQRLDKLEDLNLDTAEAVTDAALAFLRSHHGLSRLNLRGTQVSDKGMEYIASLADLTSLNIGETQVTDAGLEHLAALSRLEELDLGGNKIRGVGMDVLKLLPRLKKLSFKGIQRLNAGVCWAPVVTDAELDTISLLAGLEELNLGWGVGLGLPDPAAASRPLSEMDCHLNGGGIRITDIGLVKVTSLGQLRRLDVSGSSITAAGLARLARLPNLEQLSLWNVSALDDTAAAALAKMRALASLDLSSTSVGDATLRALTALPRLRRLYLTDTRVTAAGLAEFHRKVPACIVSWAERPARAQGKP